MTSMTGQKFDLPTPPHGTHWEHETLPNRTHAELRLERYNLVEDNSGEVLGKMYPQAYTTKRDIRRAAHHVISHHNTKAVA